MILEGEAHAMIGDMPILVLTVLRNPAKDLATPSSPFSIEPIGIALPVDDERWFNLVDTFIDAFEKTGFLDELRKNWLESNDWVRALH